LGLVRIGQSDRAATSLARTAQAPDVECLHMRLDRRWIRAWVGASLLLSLACQRKDGPPPPPPLAGVTWHTEEQWVVTDIARHIARWQGQKPTALVTPIEPRAAEAAYRVASPGGPVSVTLKDYLWSPANFVPLVSATAAAKAESCDSSDILNRLLTPTVRTLVEIDDLLSERLKQAPQNPCHHELAAVLLAVFEMREAAFRFEDQRPALNRMAAHLAIARALRGTAAPGVESRLGDLMIRAVAWRHDGFPDELRAYSEHATEPERTWLRTISLYSVQDWRELRDPAKATLAERLSYLRALSNKTDAARVLQFLEASAKEPVADWSRLAFQRDYNYETCNVYGRVASGASLAEAAEVHRLIRGRALHPEQVVATLSDEDTGEGSPRVLDWPLWAGFEQRSLLNLLLCEHNCVKGLYGADEADAYIHAATSRFHGLRLFPFCLSRLASKAAEYQPAVADSVRLVRERPELVTWVNWTFMMWPTPEIGKVPEDVPHESRWFNPLLPYGTALDYNTRFTNRNGHATGDLALLDSVRPHVFHVLIRRLYAEAKYRGKPPVAALKSLYGSTVEYDRDALVSITDAARASDPAEFLSAAQAMCQISVDDCRILADYLREKGDFDGAAREYQRWIDGAHDRIVVSNGVEWIVDYYFEHHQKEKALAIARQAGEVYSCTGLDTFALALEREGRLSDAESYFEKQQERYGMTAPLTAFFGRHTNDAHMKASFDARMAEVFPHGRQPARKEDFVGARPEGAVVTGIEGHSPALHKGDTIVAVDGIRVVDLEQFRVQNRMESKPNVTIIYQRHADVGEITMPRISLSDYTYE
jgi:tetratricopeptide (TPR) repeat protein